MDAAEEPGFAKSGILFNKNAQGSRVQVLCADFLAVCRAGRRPAPKPGKKGRGKDAGKAPSEGGEKPDRRSQNSTEAGPRSRAVLKLTSDFWTIKRRGITEQAGFRRRRCLHAFGTAYKVETPRKSRFQRLRLSAPSRFRSMIRRWAAFSASDRVGSEVKRSQGREEHPPQCGRPERAQQS